MSGKGISVSYDHYKHFCDQNCQPIILKRLKSCHSHGSFSNFHWWIITVARFKITGIRTWGAGEVMLLEDRGRAYDSLHLAITTMYVHNKSLTNYVSVVNIVSLHFFLYSRNSPELI